MNRKGFTLIELLAVIILIALIAVLIVPNIIDTMTKSKESSYQLLVKNIVTSAKTYYEECEYGDLSNTDKYGKNYACQINNNTITTTLGTLANTGMLTVSDVDPNNKDKKVVLDPRDTTKDMSACQITITKVKSNIKDDNGITSSKVTYKIEASSGNNCPKTEEYKNKKENNYAVSRK